MANLFEEFQEMQRNHLADMRQRHEQQKKEMDQEHGKNLKKMAKEHATEMHLLSQRHQQVTGESELLRSSILAERQKHAERMSKLQQEQEAETERLKEEIREIHLTNERNSREYYEEFRAAQMRMINQQRAVLTANHNEGIFRNTNEDIIHLGPIWENVMDNYFTALSLKESVLDVNDSDEGTSALYMIITDTLNDLGSAKVELDNSITSIMPRMGRIQNIAVKDGWEEMRQLLQEVKKPIHAVAYIRSDANKKLIEPRRWGNFEEEMEEKREYFQKLSSTNMELKVTVMSILTNNDRHGNFLEN